ncbi:DnaB-like helicase C-terminal domain-containing protein [Fibrobacter sp.]|uniref:DnaB-like helicase C-terminal domain-containing protein n=1 Tax=Fibrobacter sp. TaxID=35828 RepID=UPI003870A667
MTNKTDFGYMGSDFQYIAAKSLIENQQLFKDLYKILDQNCFSDPIIKKIIGTEKDMYSKNKQVPSYMEIEWKLKSVEKDEYEIQSIEEAIDKLKRTSSVGYEYVKEEMVNFFKWKYAILNVNKALEKLKDGYDEKAYKKFIKEFDTLTNPEESGSEIKFTYENFKKMLIEGDGEVIPTGIEEVDFRLAGGIGRTEIGLFTALTGYGKTTFGSVIGHNAAMRGFKVFQIYFEDKETNMLRKEAAMLYGNDRINRFKSMKDDDYSDSYARELEKRSETLAKNLILFKMPEKTTTVEDIEEEIERRINKENFRPDLIIIDYFSCLKFSRNAYKDAIAAQADCMRKIKAMADKYNIAIWVLQQNNRPSPEKTAGMGNWQGAYEATQPASVWIELQRTREQKENGRADLIFNKTRNSQPKDDLYDIVFDNSRMLIDCSNSLDNNEDLMYKEN